MGSQPTWCQNPHLILSSDLLDASSTFYPSGDKMSPDSVSSPQEDNTLPSWELLFYRMVLRAGGSFHGALQGWNGLSIVIAMGKPRLARQAYPVGFPLDCYIAT